MAFDKKQFGTAVKKLRVGLGLTQTELGHEIGLTQTAVAMIEQGERAVSMETLGKLGGALDVPSECLSILAFRPLSKLKEIDELTQSLKRLILATVDARTSTTKLNATKRSSGLKLKTLKVGKSLKVGKVVAIRR